MPPEISEPDFNIPLAWEPEKYDQKPAIENNHTDIACAKIGWQEAKNLNLFTQKLGNQINMFLNMLEKLPRISQFQLLLLKPLSPHETLVIKHSLVAKDG